MECVSRCVLHVVYYTLQGPAPAAGPAGAQEDDEDDDEEAEDMEAFEESGMLEEEDNVSSYGDSSERMTSYSHNTLPLYQVSQNFVGSYGYSIVVCSNRLNFEAKWAYTCQSENTLLLTKILKVKIIIK